MDNLAQLILKNESPSQISDAIKDALNLKALEKIDEFQPEVASNLFNVDEQE